MHRILNSPKVPRKVFQFGLLLFFKLVFLHCKLNYFHQWLNQQVFICVEFSIEKSVLLFLCWISAQTNCPKMMLLVPTFFEVQSHISP